MFLLKLIWNSSYDTLYWWTVHTFSFTTWNQWMTVTKWLSFLSWNLMHMSLWYLYVYVTPFPNGYFLFQPFIQFLSVWIISSLVKFVFERSLSRKKSQFLSKSGFVVILEFIFYNLGTFWVLTNWRRCRGRNCTSTLGWTTNLKKYFCGQTGIFTSRKVVYLP